MRQSEPGAGQHRNDRLGNHRHIDGDPVARFEPEFGQIVCGAGNFGEEVGVGNVAGVARFALPMDGDLVAVPVEHMAIHAVVGDIELAVDEPLRDGRVTPVEHPRPGLLPVQAIGLFGPERVAIGRGPLIQRRVGIRRRGELRGRRVRVPVVGGFGHLVSSSHSPVVLAGAVDFDSNQL